MRARRLPGDDEHCGWWNLLPAAPPPRRLECELEADCVVVGAGFTGLAIARRLAELRPGWRIALLEAQRVGFAASGRNSGFAGALSHRDPDVDREGLMRVVRLSRAGVAWLREQVKTHAIACDWSECGRIHAAREARSLRNLDHLRRMLDAAGESFVELDRGALAEAIGTDHYRAGVHVDGTINDSSDRDRGWTVELALPWEGMAWLARGDGRSLPPKEGDEWRMDFSRFNTYKEATPADDHGGWAWSPHGVWDSHVPECFPRVTFTRRPADEA